MHATFTIRMPNDEVVMFAVDGDEVRIYEPVGVPSRTTASPVYDLASARLMWAGMIRQGGVRFTCTDEDGHDGEPCTCSDGETSESVYC